MIFRKNKEEDESSSSLKEKLKSGAKRAWKGGIKTYENYGKAVEGTRKGVRIAQKTIADANAEVYKINKRYGIGGQQKMQGIVYKYPSRHKTSDVHLPTESYRWGL
jgi:hypothetical protein